MLTLALTERDAKDEFMEKHKNVGLEALRGLAALSVVFWHTMLGFFPQYSGLYPDKWPDVIPFNHYVWNAVFNGNAAVTLFFVLSGFVLTRQFFIVGDLDIIVRSAFKRVPRLAGPIFVTVLASYCIHALGFYKFPDVGQLTNSEWLEHFAYGLGKDVQFPTFKEALSQAVYGVLFNGRASLDSSLWTMKVELIGSFIVFGIALLRLPPVSFIRRILFFAVTIGVLIFSEKYAPFSIGCLLAATLPARRFYLPFVPTFVAIMLSLYLLGFVGSDLPAYRMAYLVFGPHAQRAYICASAILIAILALEERPHFLSKRLGTALGRLSFPIYLVHVPIICSFGCAVYLASPSAAAPYYAALASILGAVIVSIPVVYFNEWWMKVVNKSNDWLAKREFWKPIRKKLRYHDKAAPRVALVFGAYINPNTDWKKHIRVQINDLRRFGLLVEADLYVVVTNPTYQPGVAEFFTDLPVQIKQIQINTENQFEYPAISLLWHLASARSYEYVAYLHTKGISYVRAGRDRFEKVLTHFTFAKWRQTFEIFETNKYVNKIGVFPAADLEGPCKWIWFNFFWARCAFIRQLPEPIVTQNRYYYESWLGLSQRLPSEKDTYSLSGDRDAVFTAQEAIQAIDILKWKMTYGPFYPIREMLEPIRRRRRHAQSSSYRS